MIQTILMTTNTARQSDIAYSHRLNGWFGFYNGKPARFTYMENVPHMQAFLADEEGKFITQPDLSIEEKHATLISYMWTTYHLGLFVVLPGQINSHLPSWMTHGKGSYYLTNLKDDEARIKKWGVGEGYLLPLTQLTIDFAAPIREFAQAADRKLI